MTPSQRRQLALDALAGQPISALAQRHQVSRKFVCQLLAIARDVLEQAFTPDAGAPEPVLFYLPVTRSRLRQIVLALVLICHSSFRGVVEFLDAVFDYQISLGSVFNIVRSAVAGARQVNEAQDLWPFASGADDEIFQGGKPVLVGVDMCSTYCYLLSLEEHRDGDTWGVLVGTDPMRLSSRRDRR